jgi:hypothetical protein
MKNVWEISVEAFGEAFGEPFGKRKAGAGLFMYYRDHGMMDGGCHPRHATAAYWYLCAGAARPKTAP